MDKFSKIQELLSKRGESQARLNLLPYDGTPEIKTISGKQYLYIRKRVINKITSTYVGEFSDTLYNQLLRNNVQSKQLKKDIRLINKELAELGYIDNEISDEVVLNIEFARANMKQIIYDQAILEGVGTTFPDTEAIIDNGNVNNMKAEDVQKILNLKHAWEFILNKDVATYKSDYYLASYIAKIVNEGFYQDGGRIRNVSVAIGGSSYIPPIPHELDVKEHINRLLDNSNNKVDTAIELCLYFMKTQIYNDGNKRTAVIFANHFLIANGLGLLVINYEKVEEFKSKLVRYYEDKDIENIKKLLKMCFVPLKSNNKVD
ncbi:MAG: Fic family protein [Acholeplasmataceae bacterium]